MVAEPGGVLEKAADVIALQTGAVWHALASEMLDAGQLSEDEANHILRCVVEALGEVLPIAAQAVADNPAADLLGYGQAGRDIGAAMRDMRG
ncbi:hypothetical protein ACF1A5_13345 [Streptomyces sp. NPDC014864]|uniref:hypothetical protein n=1 Tax=Streptomyces sp. NPDC014864 TaxID=3364924 RepID=UPI0036FA762A